MSKTAIWHQNIDLAPLRPYALFMTEVKVRKLSVRFSVEMYDNLRVVSETMGRPMNKLVQAAVAEFLERESERLADEMSPRVEALRSYARDLKKNRRDAIHAVIDAEAEHGKDDPAEGVRVDTEELVSG